MLSPQQRIAVVLNAGAGDGAAEAAEALVGRVLREAGHTVSVLLLRAGIDVDAELRQLVAQADVVVAGGGDGTVNTVANAIIERDVTLGVLPLGTLNHFARDLGVPLEMDAAVAAIVAGHTTQVDVGMVNGRAFLNNSSLGLYPRIVQLRERYRARGVEKWLVAAWATLRVTRQQKSLRLKIEVDGADVVRTTPLLFVGNNAYRMAGMDAGSRESLSTGRLALYLVKAEGRWRLLQLVWRILTGTATSSGDLATAQVQRATVDLPFDALVTSLPVAVDGEVTTIALPLQYEIRPGALCVIVPG